MDNKDSNLKPQQTGGLKLMTVFIAVLALHVVIIGSFTVYHLMSGGTTDADIANADKAHKGLKSDGTVVTDGTTLNDAIQGADKSAAASASDTTASTTSAPASTDVATTTPTPSVTPVPATPASATPAITTPAVATTATSATITPPAPMAAAPAALAPPPENPATTSEVTADNATLAPLAPAPTPIYTPVPQQQLTLNTPTAPTALTPSGPLAAAGPVHMPPAGTSAMSHDSAHGKTYTVKITDSYKKIATAHHITVAQLKSANHIKGDTLHTGQKLIIPSSTGVLAETPAATTATHTSVSPMLANSVTSTVTPSTPHHHTYTIVKGDTLSKIAHKFKTTTSALIAANDIADPAKLTVGKKLRIPSSETHVAKVNPLAVTPPAMKMTPATVAPISAPAPAPAEPSQVQTDVTPNAQGDLTSFSP